MDQIEKKSYGRVYFRDSDVIIEERALIITLQIPSSVAERNEVPHFKFFSFHGLEISY